MTDKQVTITVPVQDAQMIINGLRELPHKFVADLIANIVNQVNPQIKDSQPE